MRLSLPTLSTLLLVFAACNGADFGGSNSNSGPTKDACEGKDGDCSANDDGNDPPPSTCVDGDKLKLEWTGEVKECLIDQGKTYNFDLKKCAEMRQSKFACDWDTVTKELEDRGLLTDVLKTDSKDGSKLVSCGQSEDGNRIVVQWVKAPESGFDCSATGNAGASIVTGCYTLYGAGDERPAATEDPDVRAKQVYDCMNKL